MRPENLASSDRGRGDDVVTGPESRQADDRGTPAASGSFGLTNRWLAAGLLVLVLGLGASIWFSGWAHERVRDGFILGGFPLLGVALMGLTLLIMLFDGQAHQTTPAMRAFRPFHFLVIVAATALVAICFIAIAWIGFVPAIALLIFVGSLGLGFRPFWIALVVAIGTSVGLRVLLLALGMSVADGPLGSLLSGGWHV